MTTNKIYDVIIIGGSYSGLAAAMALGRALRKVLIIDDGKPCNMQTPHSHNFLTNDGKTPAEIAAIARLEVRRYDTVGFYDGFATAARKRGDGFEVEVAKGESFTTRQLVFATGIRDILPGIDGVGECWGISVLHCPYCHGYEVRDKKTGVLGNGEGAFDLTRLISNWAKDLTLFTNGRATLANPEIKKLGDRDIDTIEKEIVRLEQDNGYVKHIIFKDGTKSPLDVVYALVPFEQQCKIPESLGCELTEEGYIRTDSMHETTIKGVFAIGDATTKLRTLANAVAMGTTAGMTISKKMILEEFQ